MRRHVATIVAAAFLLSIAGPVTAADQPVSAPVVDVDPVPGVEPTPDLEPPVDPSEDPSVQPSVEPSPSSDPSVDPSGAPDPAPTNTAGPEATGGAAAPPATTSAPDTNATDPAGRWIVVYKNGTDVAASSKRQSSRLAFTPERTFSHAVRGFAAKLSAPQVAALRTDASVAYVVPDEKIELTAQLIPTGISRMGAQVSAATKIDGLDERVEADVAIVDTGIASIADLNVVGGYNCSTADRTAWRDVEGHGTHVAGTAGAIDNGDGVVGVAPGVRLWAVKILDDTGSGLLSWYVCGLDWIAAQRDPATNRPMIEAVNMSVAKYGSDDRACGTINNDILHAAICRLVGTGVTVVAAAANDSNSAAARVPAAYNEVITVSALADSDGRSGGLGGNRCYSWGGYDVDDTFADFSNFGSDIDLIAPGKCIWSTVPNGYKYMSGTSMAAPHVTAAAALLKATRPYLSPGEVKEALQYLGTYNWNTATDPDPYHEKLLDVSRLSARGDFSIAVAPAVVLPEAGGTSGFPVTVTRTPTAFERISLRTSGLPAGFVATFSPPSLYGFGTLSSTLSISAPLGTPTGTYHFTVTGEEHGIVHSATATAILEGNAPTARAPLTDAMPGRVVTTTRVAARTVWSPATDPSSPIGGYELQTSVDGGAWGSTVATAGTVRTVVMYQYWGHTYQYRLRAHDTAGNWSAWAVGNTMAPGVVQDGSTSVVYRGTWRQYVYTTALGGTTRYATAAGALARTTFTGTGVAIVGPLGTTRGSVKIYVDGVYRKTVTFRYTAGQSRTVVYGIGFATRGTHTIEMRVVGNGRVDLDAFVIFR